MVIICRVGDEYVLVEQYRNPLVGVTLELPGGGRESTDPCIEATVSREMIEETGIDIGSSDVIELPSIVVCPNRLPIPVRVFFVEIDRERFSNRRSLKSETINVRLYSLSKVFDKILTGEIRCAGTMAGIFLYLASQRD